MKNQSQPRAAITTAGTTITAMATRYPFSPCHAWRRLPLPAHTASGMIITMAVMAASVFKKVSIPT